VGYYLAKAVNQISEVKSFCLNCNYKFPVRAVLLGTKNFTRRQKARAAPLPPQATDERHDGPQLNDAPTAGNRTLAQRANYPRELRVIGQELEKRRFTTFNLKCSENSYFVWSTEVIAPSLVSNAASIWSSGRSERDPDLETKMLLDRIVGFLFNASDVHRLDCEGIENRGKKVGVSDGRRLSHLLRTVGEHVYRRNQRLLAIAWQNPQISVISESAMGQREITVLRTDNLYDLWVRMYLQRSH
jgi:hypothetical protein